MMCDTRAHIWTLTDRREYSLSPGLANSRMANSCWNMRMQVRGGDGSERSLKTSGELIWYGVLEMQTLRRGSVGALRAGLSK